MLHGSKTKEVVPRCPRKPPGDCTWHAADGQRHLRGAWLRTMLVCCRVPASWNTLGFAGCPTLRLPVSGSPWPCGPRAAPRSSSLVLSGRDLEPETQQQGDRTVHRTVGHCVATADRVTAGRFSSSLSLKAMGRTQSACRHGAGQLQAVLWEQAGCGYLWWTVGPGAFCLIIL